MGNLPELGFSWNYYEHPLSGCSMTLPDPVYAGFYIQIFCAAEGVAPMPVSPSPYDTQTNVHPNADLSWSVGALRTVCGEASRRLLILE